MPQIRKNRQRDVRSPWFGLHLWLNLLAIKAAPMLRRQVLAFGMHHRIEAAAATQLAQVTDYGEARDPESLDKRREGGAFRAFANQFWYPF